MMLMITCARWIKGRRTKLPSVQTGESRKMMIFRIWLTGHQIMYSIVKAIKRTSAMTGGGVGESRWLVVSGVVARMPSS